MSLTTDESVKYGLVYIEDIDGYFERLANFSLTECAECRKACCKILPNERKKWKEEFIKRCYCKKCDIDAAKLFEILAKAYRSAHYKNHAISCLFCEVMV